MKEENNDEVFESHLSDILNPDSGSPESADKRSEHTASPRANTSHTTPHHASPPAIPRWAEAVIRIVAALGVIVLLLLFAQQISSR